jgi:hypothetical protein
MIHTSQRTFTLPETTTPGAAAGEAHWSSNLNMPSSGQPTALSFPQAVASHAGALNSASAGLAAVDTGGTSAIVSTVVLRDWAWTLGVAALVVGAVGYWVKKAFSWAFGGK